MPLLTLHLCHLVLGDTAGGPLMDNDPFAPNSVPMMGKKNQAIMAPMKRGPRFYYIRSFMPMLRLKKAEQEMPFEYKTPTWHLGKRLEGSQEVSKNLKRSEGFPTPKRSATASDIYSSAWIGSLFKPSSTAGLSKNRRLKHDILQDLVRGKRAFISFLILFFVDNCVLLNLTILFVKLLQ